MEKVWEITDSDTRTRKRRPKSERPTLSGQRDPGKAYTRSMFWWGSGQLYNNHIVKGAVFFIAEIALLFTAGLLAAYRSSALQYLRDRGASITTAFLFSELLLFLAILFWAYNAADAYHHAFRSRTAPFRGTTSRVTPFLASLTSPGWGQFLNGQPFKGSLHAALAVTGYFAVASVVLIPLFWPVLEPSENRVMVEELFIVCAFIAPFVPLLCLFSAHDAFKVSRNDLLKEPLWERMKAAYYRGRTQGWVRGVFPQIRSTLLLLLLLAFFVVIVYNWSPLVFYANLLTSARDFLRTRGMTIAPEIISELISRLPVADR